MAWTSCDEIACFSRPRKAWKSTSLFSSRNSALARLLGSGFFSFFDLNIPQPLRAKAHARKRQTIFFMSVLLLSGFPPGGKRESLSPPPRMSHEDKIDRADQIDQAAGRVGQAKRPGAQRFDDAFHGQLRRVRNACVIGPESMELVRIRGGDERLPEAL